MIGEAGEASHVTGEAGEAGEANHMTGKAGEAGTGGKGHYLLRRYREDIEKITHCLLDIFMANIQQIT